MSVGVDGGGVRAIPAVLRRSVFVALSPSTEAALEPFGHFHTCTFVAKMALIMPQLEAARTLSLNDGANYHNILPGVLPIIGAHSNAMLEVRRWGASFLSEAFAAPTWPPEEKEQLALIVLETLREYLEVVQDRAVIKDAILTAATIYPLIYRHT